MKTSDADYAYRLAGFFADSLCMRLPDSFTLAHDDLVTVLLPLTARLAIAERKARRNKKHAKAYRQVRREVRAYVSSVAASAAAAPGPAEPMWTAFHPGDWHVALVPSASAIGTSEREAAW